MRKVDTPKIEEVKKWIDTVNDMRKDVAFHAMDEYDTFIEKCLEPYGINKLNSTNNVDRVYIEEETPYIEGFESASYQRFYIDDRYEFTVVFKQKPVGSGRFISGMITTYEKVVEQDRVPKKEPMTNKKAAEILEMVRGMSANSDEEEAFAKAIAALEEQDKYQWIFGELPDPEWNKTFEEVEKALGFKLFHWQKTYVVGVGFRRWGSTTACILRDLLWDAEKSPIDYTKPASSKTDEFYRSELLKIKEKLDKAGIKTRAVLRCPADAEEWLKKHAGRLSWED